MAPTPVSTPATSNANSSLGLQVRLVHTAQRARQHWEKDHGELLPTRGTIHDLGSRPTHEAHIVALHLQGLNTVEIGRVTHHAPECVDRYINDFERVLTLYRRLGNGRSVNRIAFYTGLSQALAKQYIAIIKEHPELLQEEEAVVGQAPETTKGGLK